ncbi:hypothetical protein V7S43_010436 [Phytophthora oleae]|uniref:Uncharacterized protein n=1 Tax=Phytophthora oleae TaxID=2107226 RepID=A0ABD3FFK0_9STRA
MYYYFSAFDEPWKLDAFEANETVGHHYVVLSSATTAVFVAGSLPSKKAVLLSNSAEMKSLRTPSFSIAFSTLMMPPFYMAERLILGMYKSPESVRFNGEGDQANADLGLEIQEKRSYTEMWRGCY